MFAGRRSQLAVSGQQLAVSNGRPTSHEPLATIFPPLLPNRGGPLDRFRRGRPVSLFGPSGADQQEAQDGCQNGQLWLGVPLRESREMLFGENAIRRPQAAVCKTMPHGPVMYITIYSRRAALWDGPYAGPGRGVFTS